MNLLAVIPARYASTRFPGKPLALLAGKPVVQWVWERVSAYVGEDHTVVATDDCRIMEAVQAFGGRAAMTLATHRSGTDRCGEVLAACESQDRRYDVVINVQGDEPFVRAGQLSALVDCFADADTQIATLKTEIHSYDELVSPNNVKVICTPEGKAVYFSRQPLPYLRGVAPEQWLDHQRYYKHVGIYAFRSATLHEVTRLAPSALECSESLEQLRWLEHGYTIRVSETDAANIGIDTPADLEEAAKYIGPATDTVTM